MNAKLGTLATFVNNQNHDEKKSAGKYGETHSHRDLSKERDTVTITPRSTTGDTAVITFAMVMTTHGRTTNTRLSGFATSMSDFSVGTEGYREKENTFVSNPHSCEETF